jgi:outer membrane biosynthesis protein TonB
MSSKKKSPATPTADLQTLKIGTRVRCTDDGVTGRIVWANAVALKIRWDDGEQVTWRRDSLSGRPIEILDVEQAGDEGIPVESTSAVPGPEPAATDEAVPVEMPAPEAATTPTTPEQAPATEVPAAEPLPAAQGPAEAAPPVVKAKRQRKAPKEPKEKKLSAIDAAAKVLQEAGTQMTTQEMIAAMAAKGYWSSPGGLTPAATLYSAILREISTKGNGARFTKTERGKFALRTTA